MDADWKIVKGAGLGDGSDPYPGEGLDAEGLHDDYTNAMGMNEPPDELTWALYRDQLHVSDLEDEQQILHDLGYPGFGPVAYGVVFVKYRWDTTFKVAFSNISLGHVEGFLKQWCNQQELEYGGIVDNNDTPLKISGLLDWFFPSATHDEYGYRPGEDAWAEAISLIQSNQSAAAYHVLQDQYHWLANGGWRLTPHGDEAMAALSSVLQTVGHGVYRPIEGDLTRGRVVQILQQCEHWMRAASVKTADVPGIGEQNPGLKDWRNRGGEDGWGQDLDFGTVPGVDVTMHADEGKITDSIYQCPDCLQHFPSQEELSRHVNEEEIDHNGWTPFADPVIDLDEPVPAHYDKTVRPGGELGITTGGFVPRAPEHGEEPELPGPIPFVYKIDEDKIVTGKPGDLHHEIHGEHHPAVSVACMYKPNGDLDLLAGENKMPYSVHHLISLWYYLHPELEVKNVNLVFPDTGKKHKIAKHGCGASVKLAVTAEDLPDATPERLSALMDLVLDQPHLNTREALLRAAHASS